MDELKFLSDVGFPIALACIGFYFVTLTLKFILTSIEKSIKDLIDIMQKLDDRVAAMSHDIVRIDVLTSTLLDIYPDVDRVGRVEKADARKD